MFSGVNDDGMLFISVIVFRLLHCVIIFHLEREECPIFNKSPFSMKILSAVIRKIKSMSFVNVLGKTFRQKN